MASMCDIKFISEYRLCPLDSDLNILLEQVDQCNSDPNYKELIDKVLFRYMAEYNGSNGPYIRNIVMEYFVRSGCRKNLRKYMYEKLNSLTVGEHTLFEYIVKSAVSEVQENINNLNIFTIRLCLKTAFFLGNFMLNFSNDDRYGYVMSKVFPFYSCIMEVYNSQLFNNNFCRDGSTDKTILEYDDCYSVLNITLQHLSLALPKAKNETLNFNSVKMAIMAHEILQCHSQLKFDSISKCALLLAYCCTCLPVEETEFLKYKEQPLLDFMDNPENEYCMILKSKRLANIFTTTTMRVVLNLAVYISLGEKRYFDVHVGGMTMLEYVYRNFIDLGIEMSSHHDEIVPIGRALNGLGKFINRLERYNELFEMALNFVWDHLDHFVDLVASSMRGLLINLVREAGCRHLRGDEENLLKIYAGINAMPIFSKVRVIALHCVSQVLHCEYTLKHCPQVQSHLLTLCTNSSERDLAGQVYTNMMKTNFNNASEDEIIRTWLRPALNMLRQPNVKHTYVLGAVVAHAFNLKPTILRKLFSPKTAGTGIECVILLKCIHHARMNGICLPVDPDVHPREYWRNFILKPKLDLFMIHQNEEVRVTALQVVAECQKTTEEFTQWELDYLIKYFECNVGSQSSSARSRISCYYKKILTRFNVTEANVHKRQTSLEAKLRTLPDSDDESATYEETKARWEECKALSESYRHFFRYLLQLLAFFLSPDANSARRSTCLELLMFVRAFVGRDLWQNTFQQDEIRNLKHLLNDGYESNKAMAVALLRTLPAAAIGFDNEQNTRKFFDKCLSMACDIRPSQSVSASYMFQVILQSEFPFRTHERSTIELTDKNQCLMLLAMTQKLESMFAASKQNVVEAAKSTPFYGLLLSCRNLLQNRDIREDNHVYSFIFHKLANLCLTMKNHIMPVVCNTSPEGHIPDSSDDSDDSFLESDQSPRAQRILVYSWKTMKEIMALLGELANQTITLENVLEMLPEEYLIRIGQFFMEIFITTKHRGVFEQAHAAFTSICRSFIHSKNEKLNNMPVKWMNEGISLSTGQRVDPRLCPTRRSAGLPFLILSIIPTLSDTNPDYVRRTIEPLLAAARGRNEEHRIHSLNVLRFIFKNSKLSERVNMYVARGTIAALEGFRSKAWGIRNSATLLLSALITRMFGVPNRTIADAEQEENRMTLAMFYLRFKELFDFSLRALEEECEKTDSLILHPVLLILARLYPSHNEAINEKVKEHIPYINVCIRNPVYRTRDLAARASVSLISEHCLVAQLNDNFNNIAEGTLKDTECHGLLLQIGHIFHTTVIGRLPVSDYLGKSIYLLAQAGKKYSHLTVTLYMDIVFMLLSKYREYSNLDILKQIVELLAIESSEGNQDDELSTCKTSFAYSRFQLLTFILLTKFQHVGATYAIITRIVLRALYGRDIEMKKKCLYLFIYLNQEFSDDDYKEHPLITSGDVEISPQIKSLVHSFDFKSRKELLTYTHPYLISFFYAELKAQLKEENDYFILVFLLLRFYPCFFNSLRTERKQNILDWFLTMTKVYNEEITAGVISCLKTFIMTLEHEEMKHLRYSDLIRLLMESAAPSAADFRRLAVAHFLIGTQALFKNRIFAEYDRYNVLNIIMVLLEDDELLIRETICVFPTKRNRVQTTPFDHRTLWYIIPYKARTNFLITSTADFRTDVSVCCLTSWGLRRLPEVAKDTSEVYERGEMNTYAENIPVTKSAAIVVNTMLWNLGEGLRCEDRSIFLEEKTLLVTTIVLNSLIKVPSPMMDKQTKRTVICVFKCISKFIEECTIGNDFHNNFRTFFNSRILKFLRNSLDTDYSSTKAFLTYLYNPVLNVHIMNYP